MGKTTTPKYRLKYSFICFISKSRKTSTVAWDCKQDGRPTPGNAEKWRQSFNKSLQKGGANEHLNGKMSNVGTVVIERNLNPGFEVCRFTPPMFEVI